MVDELNPAGRLYKIIDSAYKKPDNTKVRDVWSEVLDCDGQPEAEITRKVVAVYNLCEEVQNLLELIPGINHELFLSAFPKVKRSIFPLNMGSNWQSQKRNLDQGVIATLQFCSEELKKHYSEEAISEQDLQDIKSQIEDLFEFINISKIDPVLRLALLEELERIRSAISMFKINGAKGLKQALQSTLGSVLANQEKISELHKDKPTILEKIFTLLDKLDTFTSRALKVKKIIADPIIKLLGDGGA